jgi:hypothetical protein
MMIAANPAPEIEVGGKAKKGVLKTKRKSMPAQVGDDDDE